GHGRAGWAARGSAGLTEPIARVVYATDAVNATDTSVVVVVGAGLAGLCAATELRRRGVHVRVLEASDRVGGRTYSAPLPGGSVVDLGAEWVPKSHLAIRAEADRLGLRMHAPEFAPLAFYPAGSATPYPFADDD